MENSKPRVITTYEKTSQEVQDQIKLEYPEGFSQHLIKFTNKDGEQVSALRLETEEKIFLIKMSKSVAEQLVLDDDDYDDEGYLTDEARDEIEDRLDDED